MGPRKGSAERKWRIEDCTFLAVISLLTSVLSVTRLGFYSDDWAFLKSFRFAPDQSLSGLVRTFTTENDTSPRPVQALYDAILYRLFGLNPLGYHVAIAIVIFLSLWLFYLALEQLLEDRVAALAIVLLYGLLPHYSTVRLWLATTQITVSMAAYFLAVYSDTRQLLANTAWGWTTLSVVCLLLSGLSYEAFLPLFLVNPIVMGLKHIQIRRRGQEPCRKTWEWWLYYLRNPPLILLILGFKFLVTSRASSIQEPWIKNAFPAAVELNFGAYGMRLPHVLGAIWRRYFDAPTFILSLVITLIIALYLARLAITTSQRQFRVVEIFALTLAAFVLTGLSYAYFWTTFGFGVGINNRVAVAASVPVSILIAGLAGLFSRILGRGNVGNLLFCVLISLCCGCAYWIDQTIASFWIESSHRQQVILSQIQQAIANPPKGTSILLDGYCPWTGPGIIFETDWDLTGVFAFAYNDPSIQGDVLWPQMQVSERAVLNPTEKTTYPFASLYFYDVGKQQATRVIDQEAALRLQRESVADPRNACIAKQSIYDGFGTPIW
jgi:hypothetical protein